MPRGRPKKGLSRMDAAIDAMAKFGFEKGLVRRHVKELLKEYGGDGGWPFIEDCAYKELLEAIFREMERENVAADGDQVEDNSGGDEELAGPSNMASEAEQEPQDNGPLEIAEPICPEPMCPDPMDYDGCAWEDEHPNQADENQELPRIENSPSISAEIPRLPAPRKCLHFYGWVDRYGEEEDDDFITLKPSSMVLGPPPMAGMPLQHWNSGTRKRKSRWDIRPGDL